MAPAVFCSLWGGSRQAVILDPRDGVLGVDIVGLGGAGAFVGGLFLFVSRERGAGEVAAVERFGLQLFGFGGAPKLWVVAVREVVALAHAGLVVKGWGNRLVASCMLGRSGVTVAS